MAAEKLRRCLTPILQLPEERPVTSDDYADHLPVSLDVLRSIDGAFIDGENVVLLLQVVFEHLPFGPDVERYWSSSDHEVEASRILEELQDKEESAQLLEQNLEKIWDVVVPGLDCWSTNPAAAYSACVIFSLLDAETAGAQFGKIFPFILRWLDSWLVAPRTLAAAILHILLERIPSKELRMYGRELVLYDALKGSINSQEVQVLEACAQPLLQVLRIISDEEGVGCTSIRKADHLVDQLFNRIELESGMLKKKILCQLLVDVWQLLGAGGLRWINRLSSLVQSEVQVPGEHSVILLNLWEEVSVQFPGATKRECRDILPVFFKLAWKWSLGQTGNHIDEQLLRRILVSQMKCDKDLFLVLTRGLQESEVNPQFASLTSNILSQNFTLEPGLTEPMSVPANV